MDRAAWYAMIRAQHISVRFAKEIEAHFGEYPSVTIVEALWNSDWGRECAEHFGIEELRVPEAMQAMMKQFQLASDSESD